MGRRAGGQALRYPDIIFRSRFQGRSAALWNRQVKESISCDNLAVEEGEREKKEKNIPKALPRPGSEAGGGYEIRWSSQTYLITGLALTDGLSMGADGISTFLTNSMFKSWARGLCLDSMRYR